MWNLSGFRIALIPFYPKLGEVEENYNKALEIIENLIEKKVQMAVFPELSLSGYFLENLVLDSYLTYPSSFWEKIEKISSYIDIFLGAPLWEKKALYNAYFYFSQGELKGIQKKIHLPTYGMFDEGRFFARGSKLETFLSPIGKIGVLICEDAWHPYLAYLLYKKKADVVLVPSSSPYRGIWEKDLPYTKMQFLWMSRLLTYATSFFQTYLYINRSGVEDGVYFDGYTGVFYPSGDFSFDKQKEYRILSYDPEEISSFFFLGGAFLEDEVGVE